MGGCGAFEARENPRLSKQPLWAGCRDALTAGTSGPPTHVFWPNALSCDAAGVAVVKDPNSSKQRLVNVHQAKTHLSRLMATPTLAGTVVVFRQALSEQFVRL